MYRLYPICILLSVVSEPDDPPLRIVIKTSSCSPRITFECELLKQALKCEWENSRVLVVVSKFIESGYVATALVRRINRPNIYPSALITMRSKFTLCLCYQGIKNSKNSFIKISLSDLDFCLKQNVQILSSIHGLWNIYINKLKTTKVYIFGCTEGPENSIFCVFENFRFYPLHCSPKSKRRQ